ncbi:MAG: CoA-binding protein [Dehalococcoidia bacterium]
MPLAFSQLEDSQPSLEHIFHPRSVAIVGTLSDPAYVQWLQGAGYRGSIYPVNPSFSEFLGLRAYPSIRDVPGPIDYVISCLPARLLPQLIEDCGQKGVRVIQLFTARMAETGESDRIEMEGDIVGRARRQGIRVIGPNCMGIFYPEGGLSFVFGAPRESGSVGCLSQSGGNASELVWDGSQRGIRFSKVVSYGNAADLNECDFLEYFIQDRRTTVIAAYIEGVKEGRRFLSLLRQAAAAKPVVILKGGRTAAGAEAVASHTASLAGTEAVWEALVRQTGSIAVDSLEEMTDVLLAFSCMARPEGRRVACIGGGGGGSVYAADECERVGLIVPRLPSEMKQEIKSFAPETWLLINNPVDVSVTGSPDVLFRTARLVAAWDGVDFLITMAAPVWRLDRARVMADFFRAIDAYMEIATTLKRPMAVVVPEANVPEDWKWQGIMEGQRKLIEAGFPVYPSLSRAARAVSRVLQYRGRLPAQAEV